MYHCFYSPLYLFLLLFLAACSSETPAPNVLILFTDDQRYNTIHALGNDEIRTPNIDRLVNEGTAFTRAHTMGGMHGALCVPSRAMLMTGRPLFHLLEAGGVIPEEHAMLPEHFAQAGYRTFGTGKWHNDRASYTRAFQEGDNIYFGGMHWPDDGGHEAPWVYHYAPDQQYPDENKWQANTYSSTLFADVAIAFLNESREQNSPFFAYVSFTSPHDPRTPPAPFDSWYTSNSVSLPGNYMPEHPFDNGDLYVRDEMLLEHPRTPKKVQQELVAYYGMISELDAQIGRILDALEANGQRKNTIVVFAGDNGLAVGNHGLLGKQNLYEHSMRVPLILAGPGIPKRQTRDALVYIYDLFPTIARKAGLPVPPSVKGHSLIPSIEDPEASIRESVFYAYRDLQRGVRTADNWKLIRYHVGGMAHEQLFDLNNDPEERINLAHDPDHAEKLKQMEELLVEQSRAFADPLDLSAPDWGKVDTP